MKRLRLCALILVLGWAAPLRVAAQEGTATLRGVVFDSTRMEALSGARVAVLGTSAMADADAQGRFELKGVPSGAYWVSFFHPRLQELGVSAPSMQVTFEDGAAIDVVLSVPSERTLLMGWCMAEQTGPARASLAGVVTDSLTGAPVPRAVVTVGLSGRRPDDPPPVQARTDETGYYRLCDVPAGREVEVRAESEESAGRKAALTLPAGGAQIEDLVLTRSTEEARAAKAAESTSGRSSITLSVAGTNGRRIANSSRDFSLDGLPRARPSLERRPAPTGGRTDVFDRAEIEPLLGRVSDMGELLRSIDAPELSVRAVRMADSVTGVIVPGLCVEVDRRFTGGQECAQAAILINDVLLPNPDQFLMNLDPTTVDRVEVLGAEDARVRLGDTTGNGAVLIYTR